MLQSLIESSDQASAAAFLHAVRTATFPRKLVRQVEGMGEPGDVYIHQKQRA